MIVGNGRAAAWEKMGRFGQLRAIAARPIQSFHVLVVLLGSES